MIFQPLTTTDVSLPATAMRSRDDARCGVATIAQPSTSFLYSLLSVIALVIVLRTAIFSVGVVAWHIGGPPSSWYASDQPWLAWDALHYLDILTRGYDAPRYTGDVPNDTCFFPLLPLMAYPLTFVMSAGTALLVVANAFTLGAAVLVYLWARALAGERVAALCCLLTMAYPTAVFFSSGYTEAPFLCATAAILLLVQRKQLVLAATVCGVATALRPTGAALVVFVGVTAAGAWGNQLAARCRAYRIDMTDRSHVLHTLFAGGLKVVFIGAVSVSGLMMYQSYLVTRYQRADAYFIAQKAWETPNREQMRVFAARYNPLVATAADTQIVDETTSPDALATKLFSPGALNRLLWVAVVLVTLVGLINPGPVPRAAFLIPLVIFLLGYVPGWGARSSSVARFMTAAVPCFCLAAVHLSRPTWRRVGVLLVVAMVLLQMGYAWAFSRGLWTG